MPKHHTTIAKIVATPTEKHWSQAYSAGSLFAVVALAKKEKSVESSLNVVGKGIINNLEAEFFTLEEKNLASIKEAIANAVESMPDEVALDLALAYNRDDVLYLFVIGDATIFLQREEKLGCVLQKPAAEVEKIKRSISSSSGFLKPADILVLQTEQFQKTVTKELLADALAKPSVHDTAESLTPKIDDADEAGAAAIFISVATPIDAAAHPAKSEEKSDPDAENATEDDSKTEAETDIENAEETAPPSALDLPDTHEAPKATNDPEPEPESEHRESHVTSDAEMAYDAPPSRPETSRRFPTLPQVNLNHKRKVILSITLILLFVLGFSVFSALQNRNASEQKALFTEIYAAAKKDYDEGEDLLSLNENVARDDFLSAQKTLQEGRVKFKEGSEEREQLDALLAKVESRLGNTDAARAVEAKAVSEDESELLALQIEKETTNAAKGENALYYASDDALFEVEKSKDKEIFENDEDWDKVVGIGTFGSNVYLLDPEEGVLKFTAGSSGYGKSGYFSGETPDVSKAVSMAIDGSVWILFRDGVISKYTRGKADSFRVTGLKKPFSSPVKIYTEEDFDNIYILDRGNSRVVSVTKDGAFDKEYQATILKNATSIEVNETDKKIFILAQKRVYALDME